MIIYDTEGTALLEPEIAPLVQQPQMVEFAGIKLDDKTLKEKSRLHFRVKPTIPLPELFTKITKITNEDVAGCPPFIAKYLDLCKFFLGEQIMVAHNLSYDAGLMKYELIRLGKLTYFPWPFTYICTAEVSESIHGYKMGLGDLYLKARGKTQEERVPFQEGQLVKHKSLGKCTIVDVIPAMGVREEMLRVDVDSSGEEKVLKSKMFKRIAFEGAHGALKDAEELVAVVKWLRKEGHL